MKSSFSFGVSSKAGCLARNARLGTYMSIATKGVRLLLNDTGT